MFSMLLTTRFGLLCAIYRKAIYEQQLKLLLNLRLYLTSLNNVKILSVFRTKVTVCLALYWKTVVQICLDEV